MGSSSAVTAWLGLLAFVAPALPAQAKSPFRIRLHFEDPGFLRETRAALRDVWRQAGSLLPLPQQAAPMTIHVYSDVRRCKEVAKRFGVQTKLDVPGVADPKGRAAHVLFWRSGWCRDARWRVGNLAMQLLVDEALRCPSAEVPRWLREGLAQWAEGPMRTKDAWIEPRALLRSYSHTTAGMLLQQKRLPTPAAILAGRTRLRDPQRRGLHRVFFLYLVEEHRKALRAALHAAAVAEDRAALTKALTDGLSPQDLAVGFEKFVAALPNKVDTQVFPALDPVGRPGEKDYVPASPSVMWLDRNPKTSFVLTARPFLAQIGQGDLVFERKGGKWIRVTILDQRGRGSVHVSERLVEDHAQTGWKMLAATRSDVRTIRVGSDVDLRVRARGRRLTVSIAGGQVLSVKLPGDLSGRFGVGGPFGNHVAWRKVRLR